MNKILFHFIAILMGFGVVKTSATPNPILDSAQFHLQKGTVFYKKYEYPVAVNHFKLALENAQKIGNDSLIAYSYYYLGRIHYDVVAMDKSLEYLIKSQKIFEKLNDNQGLAYTYMYMGDVHMLLNDLSKAKEFFKIAEKYALQTQNNCVIAEIIHHRGVGDFNLGNYTEALKYFKKTKKLYEECNNLEGLSAVLNNFGNYYLNKRNYDSAHFYLRKSLEIKYKIPCILGIAISHENIGEIFMAHGKLDSAEVYLKKAIYYCDMQSNTVSIRVNVYLNLSELYEKKAENVKALEYYKLYHSYSDTLVQSQNYARIQVLNVDQELNQKESELLLLTHKNQNQRIISYASLLFLCLMSVLFILIYRQYRIKKENNKILNKQKLEILDKNKQLADQSEKLKELDEVKTRFFSNISHEFRTPLTLIKGPAEQLATELKDSRQQAASMLIVRNSTRLQSLINQLLDISRIERGSLKLKVFKGDIHAYIRTRVSLFESLASEQQIHFSYQIDPEPFFAFFDPDKIEKILYNLLSNAFKYSSGKANVKVVLEKNIPEGYFTLIISDTGHGISKEDLAHIFDRFYRVEHSNMNLSEGTGIGLALVKELVTLYRGEIEVESKLGKGSTFKVKLPYSEQHFSTTEISGTLSELEAEIPENIKNTVETKKFSNGNSGPLLLLVEDNADMRQYIISNLSDKYRIIEACNGAEGIEIANREEPELIISDVMMPEMDGYQLTSYIKKNTNTSHIPVILLTAKAAEESRLIGLESEADDYLTKPFSVKELRARIQNLIHSREKLKDKFSKSIVVNPTEITTTSLDEQFLIAALKAVEKNMDNPEFTAEMLCQETSVSRANMHRKLKALTNQSATEFIRSVRLKRAAQLLEQQAGTISEIATKVGFNTLSYFSSCFKEQFNCLPSEYSKN